MHHLIVSRDFANYSHGQRIEDEEEVARILAGEHRNHVVKVAATAKEAEPIAEVKPPALPKDLSTIASKE